ncbi:MAG TPA: CBS domain-containing protein, partial [Burkholderiaceae bacterium]|nr:CBS domain-containing protein [Burkholderiaceae bacterium]
VVPLMAACVLAYTISRVLHARSIYAGAGRAQHAPMLAMAADLLCADPPVIGLGTSMGELAALFQRRRWQHVYVVDGEGVFAGAVSLHDFAPLLQTGAELAVPWPPSLLRIDFPRVRDTAPAWQVMETFATHPGERLPVLDGAGHLLGYLTKTDLVLLFRDPVAGG